MGQICSITIRNNNLNYPWTSINLYKYIYILYTYNLESNPKKCFYSPALFNRTPLSSSPGSPCGPAQRSQRPRRRSWLQTMFGAPDRPCQLCILPWQLGDHDVQGGRSWRYMEIMEGMAENLGRWVKWAPLRHGETNFEFFFWGTCPIKEPIVVI